MQPRSGSSPPVRPRRIARLFGMMSCLSPVQPLSGSRLLCQLVGEYRKSLCSAVQPPSGSNPSVHFGCRAFAAPAASARATGPTGLCDILIVADRLPRKDANGITQPRKVLYIFLNAKPRAVARQPPVYRSRPLAPHPAVRGRRLHPAAAAHRVQARRARAARAVHLRAPRAGPPPMLPSYHPTHTTPCISALLGQARRLCYLVITP